MIIPNILNAYYSYASDYQHRTLQSANDRAAYVFHGNGIWKSFDVQIKKEGIRRKVYAAICVALIVLAIFVFFAVIWPEYKDVPLV